MEVLLTHAYFLKRDERENAVMKPYPPLGLLYISAWLDKFNLAHEIYDTTFQQPEHQRQFILHQRPIIIGIYTNLMTKVEVIRLIKFIRESPDLSRTLIVLGGPDVTFNVDNYLLHGADVLVLGEGEQTFLEVVQSWRQDHGLRFSEVPGIAFYQQDGTILKTPPREKIKDLDDLPRPNRHKINIADYLDSWKNHHGRTSLSISTQRGCPYTCRWCSVAVYGQSYRRRSPQAVVQEMLHMKQTYQVDQLWFVDDVFTISHRWLEEFKEEVITQNALIPFECITRADRLSDNVIKVLKACGCYRVWIGAESGSQAILDAMDRRVNADYVREMIQIAKKNGLETGTFIMLGYPGETDFDVRLTLDHLVKAQPDWFTITITYPIKGTSLDEATKNLQNHKLAWSASTDRDVELTRTYPRWYYTWAIIWINHTMALHKMSSSGSRFSINFLIHLGKSTVARLLMYVIKMTPRYG